MINLNELIYGGQETEILEFKEAKFNYDTDKLGKYFSALSNEANLAGKERAYLLFGVKDDKTIVGTQIPDTEINNFKHEISKNTFPTMLFIGMERIPIDGKDVICCTIPAAPQGMPIAWKDHFYGREGESLGGLDLGEIERIRKQTLKSDWSIRIVDEATLDDLSDEAIKLARTQYAEKNQRLKGEIANWSDSEFLNKARLTINGKITNTAILLLGKPESEHYISPAQAKITWILKDRDGVEKDYAHFTCPMIISAQQVFNKIRNITYRYMQEGSLFPDEVLQYDPYLIRESLNNCIAHQDYTMGGKIVVVESEESFLTFKNAGDFIPGSIEKVIESDAPETVYRNPFLVSAMVNLNMIDSVGSGIRRIFNIQKSRFFPLPEYDLSGHSVKLTIMGKITDMDYAKKLAASSNLSLRDVMNLEMNRNGSHVLNSLSGKQSSTTDLTFDQTFDQTIKKYFKQSSSYQKAKTACAFIYKVIAANPNIVMREMQEHVKVKSSSLKTYLKYLVEAGFIEHVGPDNGGKWKIIA